MAETHELAATSVAGTASVAGPESLGRGLAYVHYKHTDNRFGLGIEVAVNRGQRAHARDARGLRL